MTSAALLAAIRLGLWLIPFHVLRRFLGKMNRVSRERHETDEGVLTRLVALCPEALPTAVGDVARDWFHAHVLYGVKLLARSGGGGV